MKLTFHDRPAIEDVTESEINSAVGGEDSGPYMILWSSEEGFIQAGRHGPPSGCRPPDHPLGILYREFKDRTGFEP